jgi:hypothetical protein
MIRVQNPRIQQGRLAPTDWGVVDALSPFWIRRWGWRHRYFALLICAEGLAAFEWPAHKYWATMLRIAYRAGVWRLPTDLEEDSWPLSDRAQIVESRLAFLFAFEEIEEIEVKRSRFLWSTVRVHETGGQSWDFTIANSQKVELFARKLKKHFGARSRSSGPANKRLERTAEKRGRSTTGR